MKNISDLIRILRKKTDAPITECKKSLIKSNGNIDKAEEILIIKLGNNAIRRISNETNESLINIYISKDKKYGSILEVSCETDFSTRNSILNELSKKITCLASLNNLSNLFEIDKLILRNCNIKNIKDNISGKICENIKFKRYRNFETENLLAYYLHNNNKIGVILEFSGNSKIVKYLAMHIAACQPKSISSKDIPIKYLKKEKFIAESKVCKLNKSSKIKSKIVENLINKYIKENALIYQRFIKSENKTVGDILIEKNIKIKKFILYTSK